MAKQEIEVAEPDHNGDPSQSENAGLNQYFDVIRELERRRGSRIWSMIHNGSGHLCAPATFSLFVDRDRIGMGEKVELLLHSPGGHPHIAYQVMKFFRRRFKQVNVIVPLVAKSAATLMCLAADRIYMGEFAELGPIDIQIDDQIQHGARSFSPLNEFKSIEFMREQAVEWMHYYSVIMNARYGLSFKEGLKDSIPLVTGLLRPVFQQIEPLEMGEHRRSLAISEGYAQRMIELVGNQNARSIVKKLVWEYPSHDFCIDYEEAGSLGLPVDRLSEEQDRLITTAIINLEEDEFYHGFTPKQEAPKSAPVRKSRNTTARKRKGPNGRADDSPTERV